MPQTAKKTGKRGPRPEAAKREPKKRTPRQGRLPGTEDNAILDIEEAAIQHSDIRSEMAAKKVDLKAIEDKLSALMKREGKKEYRRGSVHVRMRLGHDTVSVQVKRHEREDGEEEPEGE